MSGFSRPLTGWTVGISVSETDDSPNRGFPSWQVSRVTLQIVSALFGQGAAIAFGHDWREDGIMQAVHAFALQAQSPIALEDIDNIQPKLLNYLPWPEIAYLSSADLEQLSGSLRVERVQLPENLRATEREALAQGPESPLYRYLRARALTGLRLNLTQICDARICIGGRQTGFEGRYPGVIEECLLALRARKPLYLAGILGGATEQVIAMTLGREVPDPPFGSSHLYANPPVAEDDQNTVLERVVDPNKVRAEFAEAGLKTIAEANLLSEEENMELFTTPVVDRATQLILIGLGRLCAKAHE